MRRLDTERMGRRAREYREARAYTEAIKAPLSDAAIEALITALKSGDVPRYKVARKRES